jgi:hypothetical protein
MSASSPLCFPVVGVHAEPPSRTRVCPRRAHGPAFPASTPPSPYVPICIRRLVAQRDVLCACSVRAGRARNAESVHPPFVVTPQVAPLDWRCARREKCSLTAMIAVVAVVASWGRVTGGGAISSL